MPERIHVYPVDRKHRSTHITTHRLPCWCPMEELNICSEADARGECVTTCWRCRGRGLVPIYDQELTVFLVHADGRLTDGA